MKRTPKCFVITIIQPPAITGLMTAIKAIKEKDTDALKKLETVNLKDSAASSFFNSTETKILL